MNNTIKEETCLLNINNEINNYCNNLPREPLIFIHNYDRYIREMSRHVKDGNDILNNIKKYKSNNIHIDNFLDKNKKLLEKLIETNQVIYENKLEKVLLIDEILYGIKGSVQFVIFATLPLVILIYLAMNLITSTNTIPSYNEYDYIPVTLTGNIIDVYGGNCELYKKYPRTIDSGEFKSMKLINENCYEINTYNEGYLHIPVSNMDDKIFNDFLHNKNKKVSYKNIEDLLMNAK